MESNEIKNTALIFLTGKERLTAVVGTCATDGTSHVATIYYYVDDELNFYFLTATNTQKHKNLLENAHASIVVGFGPEHITIQGHGSAILLDKASEEENNAIARIKKRLQEHASETWPVFQLEAFDSESIAVFKFVPDSLELLNLEHDNGLTVTTEEALKIV